MPAQKRSAEEFLNEEFKEQQKQRQQQEQEYHLQQVSHHHHSEQGEASGTAPQAPPPPVRDLLAEARAGKKVVVDEESDGDDPDKDEEFIFVKLGDIRNEVGCAICLGIIKNTRTVMECLHRFCRDCIDKSIRYGKKQCPTCRKHCSSRRALRDDPNFDALIAILYPNIENYEMEEAALHDEEMARNDQVQESIAETFRRQMEALGNRKAAKRKLRQSRKEKNGKNSKSAAESPGDDDEGNASQGGRELSSEEERVIDVKAKKLRNWGGARFRKQPVANKVDESLGENNDSESIREVATPSTNFIAWGRGGARSGNRHGSSSGGNKNWKALRINKVVDYIRKSKENVTVEKMEVHLMLIPVDTRNVPSLLEPYLCCRPTLSIRHLCEYISREIQIQAEEVDILLVKEPRFVSSDECISLPVVDEHLFPAIDPYKDELQPLEHQETLSKIQANVFCSHLVLAYRLKGSI